MSEGDLNKKKEQKSFFSSKLKLTSVTRMMSTILANHFDETKIEKEKNKREIEYYLNGLDLEAYEHCFEDNCYLSVPFRGDETR